MNTKSKFGPWIKHQAGEPCPIPHANAGDYELRFLNGDESDSTYNADWWSGGYDSWRGQSGPNTDITHYRLRKPPVDWKAIADELATALTYAHRFLRPDEHDVEFLNNAITRYRKAYK